MGMAVDDDFEDLFAEIEVLECSSQESLTHTATDSGTARRCQGSGETEQYRERVRPSRVNSGHQTSSESSSFATGSSSVAIDKIEDTIEQVVERLAAGEDEVRIALGRRPKSSAQVRRSTGSVSQVRPARVRHYCFPGSSEDEAWRFTMVLRILELMHEALCKEVVISKRDIFYRDPALFGSQSQVDRYVDDIAFTFQLSRSSLNVAAVAKGLMAGCARFYRRDGTSIDAISDREGQLVPVLRDLLSVRMEGVKWILVVEKEATFRSIAASNFWETVISEGFIITGKGYPDVATREMLCLLANPCPRNGFSRCQVYGLADFDPDGFAILSTYKHGSIAMAHENEHLSVPMMKWIGLCSEHVLCVGQDVNASQGLLHLSKRDRSQARRLLHQQFSSQEATSRELQIMMYLNLKAELQLLDAVPSGLEGLLKSRLLTE